LISQSSRFERSYQRCGLALKGLVEGAIQDFVERLRQSPDTCLRHYDRHAQLRDVLEVDVSGQHRLLVTLDEGELILLDFGDHDVVAAYSKGKLAVDLLNPEPALHLLTKCGPAGFFASNPCKTYSVFETELDREWLYFLSDQQLEIWMDIGELEGRLRRSGAHRAVYILGGPGTGKTCVLLELLKHFTEIGQSARISMSDTLAGYIEASLPDIGIERFRATGWEMAAAKPDIALFDDPSALDLEAGPPGTRLTVYAFDPLQLGMSPTKDTLRRWARSKDVRVYHLTSCYRQKENVGQHVAGIADIAAQSTARSRSTVNDSSSSGLSG
jgi:hypothetical protein